MFSDITGNSGSMSWQIGQCSVKERLEYLLRHSIWTDCKFVVGRDETNTKEFSAHMMVLAMSSSKFVPMRQDSVSPIRITTMHPDIFSIILEYLYTDQVSIKSVDQAFELYTAATEFDLSFLSKYCMNFILENVDSSNAISVYECAKLYNYSNVIGKSMEIISKRTTEILSTAQFLTAQYQTVLDILDQNKLNVVSELELFNAFQTWALASFTKQNDGDRNTEKLRRFAEPGLQKIRFLSMSIPDFLNGPMNSELLTKEESCNLLTNISSSQPKLPIPAGFSNNNCLRVRLATKKLNINCDLYLPRVVQNSVTRFNDDRFVDVVKFTADDDVQLVGLQIPSQIIDSSTSTIVEYNESLLISVIDVSCTKNWKTDGANKTSDSKVPIKAAPVENEYCPDVKPPYVFPAFPSPNQPSFTPNENGFGTAYGNAFPMHTPFGHFNQNFMAGFPQSSDLQPAQSNSKDGGNTDASNEPKSTRSCDETELTPLVTPNSMMCIKLSEPVHILKNRMYELKVTLCKTGCYQIGYYDRTNRLLVDNVQFELAGYADIAFVTSLIFNH